jgi:hypothetical protein
VVINGNNVISQNDYTLYGCDTNGSGTSYIKKFTITSTADYYMFSAYPVDQGLFGAEWYLEETSAAASWKL